jgi:predicted enzyme related to lactoylglutathione lyase
MQRGGIEMLARLRSHTIWSQDLKNLLPFYRDLLGLRVEQESDGFAVLALEQDGARLYLGTHSEVRGKAAEPHRHMIGFDTGDLAADFRRLREAGVEVVEPPTDHRGLRIAALRDPEGNLIRLFQPTA